MYTPAVINVVVPELRQRALSDAQKLAADAHLRLQVSGDAPADPSKAVVVQQTPDPNTTVRAGSVVIVVVQVPGARQTFTVVPDLQSRSLTDARPLVTSARLKLEVSGTTPEDTSHSIVVSQSPAAGTRVPAGSTVTVTVRLQRGENLVTVPELRPRLLPDAQRIAAGARLSLEVSGGRPVDPSRASVVTQKPPAGTRVPAGSSVVVTVQTPQTEDGVAVPDVRGQLLLEAQRRVSRAGLRLEVAGGWPTDALLAMVVDQKPGPQARVSRDSVVVVAVRNPTAPPQPAPPGIVSPPTGVSPPRVVTPPVTPPREEWVLVPALRQRPLMDALQRVRNARLRLEVTGGWPSDPERAAVFEQQPAQDTRVPIGSVVTVQITPPAQALQPPPAPPQPSPPPPPAPAAPPPRQELVTVPELRQQLLADARGLTSSARLELRVRGQSPADETRAIVVSQRPAAGARVATRSAVLVELGPALLAVPDLRRHPLDEARQIVSQAGFELAIMGDPPSSESRAQVVEQAPLPGVRATAGSTITVRAKASLLTTWVMAGAGALLAAAGAAFGIARWHGLGSHPAAGLPGVRVVANSDVGKQEIRSSGVAADGFALRLRSRIDAGSQTVDANAGIVTEERRSDG